ncbi:hypothetical protein E2F43_15035 [Seongchinamella unica]|uniref:Uncharacterized protein n=1 Tax=Seongchinamella unica TaxID=2547392 RepID=A0A4R5LQQ6_9GAMM|nr:hypothetical protein [Seongchinamella unica]TDG12871.1 hypothetical protein E2F43_15035 [Seongchinamella unica]
MILYRPTDGEVLTTAVTPRPKTCFLMTQLGTPVPAEISRIRSSVENQLKKKKIELIDADSVVTGGDFLDKIWRLIVSVPIGVAIIHEDMSPKTVANIFYELGMMDALGKHTVVVKSPGAAIPSDFVRTEYIRADGHFNRRFGSFLDSTLQLEEYFVQLADELEKNPLLSIDYLRRAHLLAGNSDHRKRVQEIVNTAEISGRAKNSVEMLLARF